MTEPDIVDGHNEPRPVAAGEQEPRAKGGRSGARRRILATAAGSLVLVTSLGTSAVLGWRAYHQHQLAAASESALQAARDYAALLTTLDANHIDDNYRRSLDGATGEFKDAYSQGSAQLRQLLIDNRASGSGVVIDAAVKSVSPNAVGVLLFVDQSITNAANPSPRIDRNRIAMTMTLVGGRWLASKVEVL